ncbi:GTP-binding protein [Niveomyces insectorum RCEF 264]|uniref:GTP-binding protein n=1 Tax=Niveomyces insectorum RCEF 264 TaxID=1081102 RepID=A0A167S0R3_9HYPO|nr:GTP-binding protein [Niveomyces insectorum RCEF 264]
MPRDPLIGLVGKPSAGKSSMLNSLTDASSKVGNFPFTTIDPQRAVGYLQVDCACARYGVSDRCRPNYGACVQGRRAVPIELLDVAGLVPGAHQGRGLGNKFLDDLRHADALIHVVDVSGTTDAEGKTTRGYDPSVDIAWLRGEIVQWIKGNLADRWPAIRRRHVAAKMTTVATLQAQLSGYGSTSKLLARTLDRLALRTPLEQWDDATLDRVVNAFADDKFPTVLALNKIDHPDADRNIAKITKMHAHDGGGGNEKSSRIVLCSALAEIFLRKMAKQGYLRYVDGSSVVDTRADLLADGDAAGADALKELDEKNLRRVENLRDMVLYRFGSTGVAQALSQAADMLGLIPVFPVRSIAALGALGAPGSTEQHGASSSTETSAGTTATATTTTADATAKPLFRDCVLIKRGSTVAEVARKCMGDAPIAFVEGAAGTRVAEDDTVDVGKNDILSFKVGRA